MGRLLRRGGQERTSYDRAKKGSNDFGFSREEESPSLQGGESQELNKKKNRLRLRFRKAVELKGWRGKRREGEKEKGHSITPTG